MNRLSASCSIRLFGTIALLCSALAPHAYSQQQPPEPDRMQQLYNTIHWEKGPTTASVGAVAEIKVPLGFQFTGPTGAAAWAEINHNPVDPQELGVMMALDDSYFLTFAYHDVGYVPDDEKAHLDASGILQSIRDGNEAANNERRSRGWPDMKIIGWITPPIYETSTNRLAWAIRGISDGKDEVANYNTRLLGRAGVMSVTLVSDPGRLNATIPTVNGLLSGFSFITGNKYAEWRKGDKVAAYGLTGLITGGATVVAAKTGLLAKLGAVLAKGGKAIFIVIAAFFAAIWKALTGKPKGANAS